MMEYRYNVTSKELFEGNDFGFDTIEEVTTWDIRIIADSEEEARGKCKAISLLDTDSDTWELIAVAVPTQETANSNAYNVKGLYASYSN